MALIFLRSSKVPRRLKVCLDFFFWTEGRPLFGVIWSYGVKVTFESTEKKKSNIFTAVSKILYCIKHLGRTWALNITFEELEFWGRLRSFEVIVPGPGFLMINVNLNRLGLFWYFTSKKYGSLTGCKIYFCEVFSCLFEIETKYLRKVTSSASVLFRTSVPFRLVIFVLFGLRRGRNGINGIKTLFEKM